MADIKFAIAVLRDEIAYPIRATADDRPHNALKALGPSPEGAAFEAEDQDWFDSAIELLDAQTTVSEPHAESEGAQGGPPPLVEANATPWYAVFEDKDGVIWAARFFGPNLPGKWRPPGVHIVPDDPGSVDAGALSGATLSVRSVIMITRADFGEDTSAQHDHGGGGGTIRTDW